MIEHYKLKTRFYEILGEWWRKNNDYLYLHKPIDIYNLGTIPQKNSIQIKKIFKKNYIFRGRSYFTVFRFLLIKEDHNRGGRICVVSEVHNIYLTWLWMLKFDRFRFWSCGLHQSTLKSWHLLRNICEICKHWAGYYFILYLVRVGKCNSIFPKRTTMTFYSS